MKISRNLVLNISLLGCFIYQANAFGACPASSACPRPPECTITVMDHNICQNTIAGCCQWSKSALTYGGCSQGPCGQWNSTLGSAPTAGTLNTNQICAGQSQIDTKPRTGSCN